jgi:DNA-binding transcriptional ArsR family regulator
VRQAATFGSCHHAKGIFISKLDRSDHRVDGRALSRIGEVSRRKLIFAAGNGKKNVTQLIAATGSTQANVSKHLALLAAAGILKREKDGRAFITA